MRNDLTECRKKYFMEVAGLIPKMNVQFVVLTHVLEDRPELLSALAKIAPITSLIAIPYSIHEPTLFKLKDHYSIVTPTLDQLYDSDFLFSFITQRIREDVPLIIVEIGGYFASIIDRLKNKLGKNLLGVIEDTELGHRQYEKLAHKLTSPVISVARSLLKANEDFLVGASCLYSTEKLLRQVGFPIEGKASLILGFGKVGRGTAYALLKRHCPVMVYDTNSLRRINALSEGFKVFHKQQALQSAEMIYGATGSYSLKAEDFKYIKNGTLLVSCSSKDVEFDLAYLNKHYQIHAVLEGLDRYENKNNAQFFYVAAKGRPINFMDGAVIGPMLALVQAEIILGIKQLFDLQNNAGIFETPFATKEILATKWLNHFYDDEEGRYRLHPPSNINTLKNLQIVNH